MSLKGHFQKNFEELYPFSHIQKCESLSHVQLFVTPWTVARQAPLSMKSPRQEY